MPILRIIVVLLPLFTCGCIALPQACLPPSRVMLSAELMFGRSIGDRVGVSEADFAAFAAAEITPRFPDGLTIVDARGQWRDQDSQKLVREPSKLVKIVFADEPQKRGDLDAIVIAYKKKFRQQAVLASLQTSCVAF